MLLPGQLPEVPSALLPHRAKTSGVTQATRPGFGGSILGYCRVSRSDQDLRRQVDALQEAGCDRIFQDHGVSGSATSRPGLDELLAYARPGDVIVVQALDRLGRNTRHLLTLVDHLHERQVSLRILTLGVDTATPAGQLVMTVMAALAAMEKALLVERVHSGQKLSADVRCNCKQCRDYQADGQL